MINRCFTKLILITLVIGWSLSAQGIGTFIREAKQSYTKVRDNVLKSAEWMPEEDYSFRPTPESRTFGQLIGELATAQSDVCSAITANRPQGNGQYAKSKADLVEALARSIRVCDSAYASVTAYNANQEVGFGSMRHSKLGLLFLNASHENELYGRLEVYLRLKGFLPPSEQARIVPLD